MREREVEAYLDRAVRRLGGATYKWTSPGRRGVPDRIVFCYGSVLFVEVKAPGKTPTVQQLREHRRLQALGQVVLVVSSVAHVDVYFPAPK